LSVPFRPGLRTVNLHIFTVPTVRTVEGAFSYSEGFRALREAWSLETRFEVDGGESSGEFILNRDWIEAGDSAGSLVSGRGLRAMANDVTTVCSFLSSPVLKSRQRSSIKASPFSFRPLLVRRQADPLVGAGSGSN